MFKMSLFFKIIILAVVLLLISTVVYMFIFSKKIASKEVPAESPESGLSFSIGQILKYDDMEITFVRVVGDSRCPEGAECFWAGELVIQLRIKTNNETSDFFLSNLGKPVMPVDGYTIKEENYSKSSSGMRALIYKDYSIYIADIFPKRTVENVDNISEKDYKIALSITK